jgi:hypothetical protein
MIWRPSLSLFSTSIAQLWVEQLSADIIEDRALRFLEALDEDTLKNGSPTSG